MFSELDNIIFPDSCEVIQVASQQFVYPIFKNGKSSLTESIIEKDWTVFSNEDIRNITDPITVFLRDPRDRFISGVNTYVQQLQKKNPTLDLPTVLFFINQYYFLNRHFCPQFFWLINLARYTAPTTMFNFCNYQEISKLTWRNSKAEIEPASSEILNAVDQFDWKKLELYFFLDQILIDLVGSTMPFNQVIIHIRKNHSELYRLIFGKSEKLVNVLSKI